ncbi:MAG TPA: hypothetical protein VNM38_08110 [Solirubrobacterales bacterium]|nr:hypothetical protein [Solirubrobacterales bacterium]
MAVMVPREELTEHRLDALEKKVDDGFADIKLEMKAGFDRMEAKMDERFAQMDKRFAQMDERFAQMDKRFAQMDKRFEKVDARFERMEDRFHTLNLAFIGGAAVVIATLLGGILF